MSRTSFLAIGHASRDEFPDGRWRLGGSALYGAATAAKLGADVTLVTRVGPAERGALETLCGELGITLRVLAAQGMLRSFAKDGTVVATPWAGYAKLLPKVDAVVVSEEDHAEDSAWLPFTTVVVTQAERGSDLHVRGSTTHVHAFAVPEVVDQTGAGDAFAASLALGLAEGLDVIEAAMFASAAASFAVEGLGMSRLADRTRVRARMRG